MGLRVPENEAAELVELYKKGVLVKLIECAIHNERSEFNMLCTHNHISGNQSEKLWWGIKVGNHQGPPPPGISWS
jgi:hypothetical protein